MRPADVAWLRMDTPVNPMSITGVMTLGTPMPFETAVQLFDERMLIFERFRQRVRGRGGAAPRWRTVPGFSAADAFESVRLADPESKPEFQRLVSRRMSGQVPLDRPGWDVLHIGEYRGGSALVVRIHHAIGDGIALMHVLLSMADETFDASRAPAPEPDTPEAPPEPVDDDYIALAGRFASRTAKLAGQALLMGAGALEAAKQEAGRIARHPSRLVRHAEVGLSVGAALSKIGLMAADSDTIFKRGVTGEKHVAWTDAIPVSQVRAIGDAAGAKINDVLLSAATGALRRYLIGRGEPIDGVELRVAVPVNLRAQEDAYKLGNDFGLVFLELPVGIEDPAARLADLKRRMDRLKHSPEAVVTLGVLQTIGLAPPAVHELVVEVLGAKTSGVMTNVPGPRDRMHLGGSPITGLVFWVPQTGEIGLGLSIFSYAGEVRVGVSTDERIAPDPETITAAVRTEIAYLADVFGVA